MTAAEKFYADQDASKGMTPRDPRSRTTIKILNGIKAASILDIGCSNGDNCLMIAKAVGAEWSSGVDISSSAVELARSKGMTAFKANLDAGDLPFADSSFDLVVATEVIEHLYDTDHLMDEMKRTMKPDGYAFLTTPNLSCWANRLALLLGYQPFWTEVSTVDARLGKLNAEQLGPAGHLRLFTRRAFHEFAALHGFRIVEERGSPFRNGRTPFDMADHVLSRTPTLAGNLAYLMVKV